MKRREAIVGIGLLAAMARLKAQQSSRIPRVGVLHPGSAKEAASVQREPFERGLRELGWLPGSTVLIDYRYAEGNPSRLSELANELVRSKVNVIVARSDAAVQAARQATSSIPIVMSASNDPVAQGFFSNLSRPGGNITGIATRIFQLDAKRLELMKESVPGINRVAVLANPNMDGQWYEERMAELHGGARSLKLQVQVFEVKRADEIIGVFKAITAARMDALLVRGDSHILDHSRGEIASLATKNRLPAIYPWRFFVDAGGLMSYGTSLPGFHHQSATYVSRILKGTRPGDLAIEQPTKFELIINLKAAKAIGLKIPKAVLFRADELIQ
jgi:putative ABC transport system substrate-binding protein